MATVLLVGSDIDLATMTGWLLEEEGHVVAHTQDGDVAIAMLRACPQPMVVVLLTTRPHVKAQDILEVAVQEPQLQRHAFILLTGLAERLPLRWQELVTTLAIPVLAKPSGVRDMTRTVAASAARLHAPRPSCGTTN